MKISNYCSLYKLYSCDLYNRLNDWLLTKPAFIFHFDEEFSKEFPFLLFIGCNFRLILIICIHSLILSVTLFL